MATVKGRAALVSAPNADIKLVDKEFPDPPAGHVRVRVEACGICHSDSVTVEGLFPGLQYPRTPGHEVAGRIDAIGEGVKPWKIGQRVGIGWLGGYCGYCESCRRGKFILCDNAQFCGVGYDGGYAEYMITPATGLALIPDELDAVNAGPLLCAGITTFNALRNSKAQMGSRVAILGIGGLGHLAVQFAARAGFHTIAIARGKDKEALARELGAHEFVDSTDGNTAESLQKLGGADVILNTADSTQAMEQALGGLRKDGEFINVGVTNEAVSVPVLPLILMRQSFAGWPAGSARDSEDTLNFSAWFGVKPMIEEYPLERAAEAYGRMMSGKARFRVVLRMDAK